MAYIVEAKGLESFVKKFDTLEKAQAYWARAVKKAKKDYDISEDLVFADVDELEGEYFTYGATEEYLAIWVYKQPETLKEKILVEIERAEYGMAQYQYELEDSSTCTAHLWNIKDLVKDLKEG